MSILKRILNTSLLKKRDLKVEDSGIKDRKEAERAAREFVLNYYREHGTLPKWDLLMKDPKFAAAVAAENERILAEAAKEILARQLKEKQLMEELKKTQTVKKKLVSFVGDKKSKLDMEKSGPMLREGVSTLSPAVAEKFRIADKACQELFGHPVQIKPPLEGMKSPISYKDGVIYLSPDCPRAQLVGGIIFELNNAVKCKTFKKIEEDWESEKIMTSDPSEYGITDPGAAKIFSELKTPAERRALAQEYIEWEHMMNGTIREQEELSRAMNLDEGDSAWTNYITTMCPGATNGAWNTFEGYFKDKDGHKHYEIVLSAIQGSSKTEEPESSVSVTQPKFDYEQIAGKVLGNLKTPVPGGKLEETIKRLIKLATESESLGEDFELFATREAKKFSKGEFTLNKRDFDEELWNNWMKG